MTQIWETLRTMSKKAPGVTWWKERIRNSWVWPEAQKTSDQRTSEWRQTYAKLHDSVHTLVWWKNKDSPQKRDFWMMHAEHLHCESETYAEHQTRGTSSSCRRWWFEVFAWKWNSHTINYLLTAIDERVRSYRKQAQHVIFGINRYGPVQQCM